LSPPSPRHFAVVRIAVGAYLAVHFASLVPYAGELFSVGGMLPDYDRLPSAGYFPNPLKSVGGEGATLALVLSVGLALLFAAGVYRRIVALGLWLAWASFFNRNPFIANPSIPYVGWLLLACAVIPDEAPLRPALPRAPQEWEVPRALYVGAWLLLGLGYTLSGLHKLGSPSWRDGTALRHVLELPLARDTWLRAAVLSLPDGAFATLTYGALFAELSALPLFVIRRLRPFAWWGLVAMQLGILCLLDFADLTLGMLLFHAFVFDVRWPSGGVAQACLRLARSRGRDRA
jgi:hypothetical protein